MSAVKEVNHAFRLLSAFAIIAVVAGHMNDGGLRFLYKLFPEYQFHLATFIFIAGYFYSPKAEDAILPYIRKKLLRLMVPMYAWNLVYGVAIHVMKSAGLITFGEELSFDSLVVLPLWHGHPALQYLVAVAARLQIVHLCRLSRHRPFLPDGARGAGAGVALEVFRGDLAAAGAVALVF